MAATMLSMASRSAGVLGAWLSTMMEKMTVLPLARHLGIDHWVTNRLEYVDGKATGRLLPPV